MTRFWFALSMGGEGSEDWLQETIVDVQEIIPTEIWCITLHKYEDARPNYNVQTRTLYVLEATCEVVGHPPTPTLPTTEPANKKPTVALRADWSAYITSLSHPIGNHTSALIASHLKWANFEEYDRGISRLWLKRTAAEREIGAAKLTVAWRYVFACVVGNRYASSSEARR